MNNRVISRGSKTPGKRAYAQMVRRASEKTKIGVTALKAFLIGGSICLAGEVIRQALLWAGVQETDAGAWVSVILVLCSAIATGLGQYEKLAKHGGAGTLVPVTGFANAVAAAAVEAKTEGFIMGVGTKIFTIAGPVILYGTAAASLYGLILLLTGNA